MSDGFEYKNDYRIRCSSSSVNHTNLIGGYEIDDLGTADLTWNDEEEYTPQDYDDDYQSPTAKRPKTTKSTNVCEEGNSSSIPTNSRSNIPNTEGNLAVDFSSYLSDEILVRLFKYLPKTSLYQCLQVCRRWKNIALDTSCWTSINLSHQAVPFDSLMMILERKVTTARLSYTTICQPHSPIQDNQKSRMKSSLTIQYLDATCCLIPDEAMSLIIKNTTKLKKVSFANTLWSDKVLRLLGESKSIVELNLCSCQSLSDYAMKHIVKSCTQLKCLNLSWSNITQSGVEFVVSNLPELMELDVSGLRSSYDDDMTDILATNHPRLTHIDFSDCTQITNRSTELLSHHCKEIEFLGMSRCCNVSTDFISTISAMKKLKDLQIFGFNDTTHIEFLQRSFRSLQINKKTFSNIARPCKSIKYDNKIWNMPCT